VAQSGDDCIVRSDPRQLRPLLANLIANAVAYSRDNTTIDIGLQASPDGACCVRVSDRGIGIPADKLPRIFDEYYRTAEAARVNRMSTGLGLAIVRQAARNLGLSITVTSEPGSGTQFAVRFPKQMEADSGECTHH